MYLSVFWRVRLTLRQMTNAVAVPVSRVVTWETSAEPGVAMTRRNAASENAYRLTKRVAMSDFPALGEYAAATITVTAAAR